MDIDVTQRKKIGEALQESEEKEKMTEMFQILEPILDKEGKCIDFRYIKVNRDTEAFTGKKREEIEGKTARELWGIVEDCWFEMLGRVLKTSEPAYRMNYIAEANIYYDVHAWKADDRRVAIVFSSITEIKRAMSGREANVRLKAGITERKHAEEELNRLNRVLRALGNSNRALLRAQSESELLNDVCRIIVNDCNYSMVWIGYTDDEGMTIRPVAFAGFGECYLEALQSAPADTEHGLGPVGTAMRTGHACQCNERLKDFELIPWHSDTVKQGYISSLAVPLLIDGKIFGAITIYLQQLEGFSEDEVNSLSDLAGDLTYGIMTIRLREAHRQAEEALKKSAEDLERSNRDLDQFASIAAHDLQSPLRNVRSFAQLLAKRYSGKLDADADKYIKFVVEGAAQMSELVSGVLDYSRINSGGHAFKPTNCKTSLTKALFALRQNINDAGAEVTYDPLPIVQGDSGQMTQLFQNLIGNGVKFHSTGTAPRVHVSVSERKEHWLFSVRDNGIGIEPEYREKIFEMFRRLQSSQEFSGTGIGLAICKRIVERHGGRIWFESKPGDGTTFFFTLPNETKRLE